jgi:hypothetical protein
MRLLRPKPRPWCPTLAAPKGAAKTAAVEPSPTMSTATRGSGAHELARPRRTGPSRCGEKAGGDDAQVKLGLAALPHPRCTNPHTAPSAGANGTA